MRSELPSAVMARRSNLDDASLGCVPARSSVKLFRPSASGSPAAPSAPIPRSGFRLKEISQASGNVSLSVSPLKGSVLAWDSRRLVKPSASGSEVGSLGGPPNGLKLYFTSQPSLSPSPSESGLFGLVP